MKGDGIKVTHRNRQIRRRHLLVDVAALTGGGCAVDALRSHSWMSAITAVILLGIAFLLDRDNIQTEEEHE